MLEEYDGLILKLRNAGKESFLFGDLMRDAANVIEELSKENESLGKDLTSAVEMVKKKRKPKWIPVTERLPEIGENVLLYAYGRVHFGRLLFLENNFGHPTFLMEQSGLQHAPVLETTAHNESTKGRITHWMLLPEPPEKESES